MPTKYKYIKYCTSWILGYKFWPPIERTSQQAGTPEAICEIEAGTGHHFPMKYPPTSSVKLQQYKY